jgi:hypothetical protein
LEEDRKRELEESPAGNHSDFQFQFTDTFVKNGGRRRLLAGHVSKLPGEEK